jgi:hypothetical protein
MSASLLGEHCFPALVATGPLKNVQHTGLNGGSSVCKLPAEANTSRVDVREGKGYDGSETVGASSMQEAEKRGHLYVADFG